MILSTMMVLAFQDIPSLVASMMCAASLAEVEKRLPKDGWRSTHPRFSGCGTMWNPPLFVEQKGLPFGAYAIHVAQ